MREKCPAGSVMILRREMKNRRGEKHHETTDCCPDDLYEYMRFDEIDGDEYLTELTSGYEWTISLNVSNATGTGVGSVDTDWDSWNAE